MGYNQHIKFYLQNYNVKYEEKLKQTILFGIKIQFNYSTRTVKGDCS